MKLKEIVIKKNFGDFTKGQIIRVGVDKLGIPLDQYWRQRLKDSTVDKCCIIRKCGTIEPDKAKKVITGKMKATAKQTTITMESSK